MSLPAEVGLQKFGAMKPNTLTLLAGFSLLVPPLLGFAYGALFAPDQSTSVMYPIPALVLLPLFFIGPFAIFVPLVLFFIWNAGLLNGDAKTPKRTYVLLAVTTLLSVPYFMFSWRDGVVIQGLHYNFTVLGANFVCLILLWFCFVRNWRAEPSFRSNLFLHWALFLWLAWYAFPFFGEMI